MVGMALTVLRALIEILFPTVHDGQIRVAGEVIAEESLSDEGDALTRTALDEAPTTSGKETITR
jgi:hypothetical protein